MFRWPTNGCVGQPEAVLSTWLGSKRNGIILVEDWSFLLRLSVLRYNFSLPETQERTTGELRAMTGPSISDWASVVAYNYPFCIALPIWELGLGGNNSVLFYLLSVPVDASKWLKPQTLLYLNWPSFQNALHSRLESNLPLVWVGRWLYVRLYRTRSGFRFEEPHPLPPHRNESGIRHHVPTALVVTSLHDSSIWN